MQSPEGSDEQALAAQEGQIAAQHLEMDCQSVTSENSHASSAHDQVDNQRDSPMPQPIPIALTLAQPPDSAEREYATLTPLSSAVTMPHVMTPLHYASYVPMQSAAVSAVEAAPAVVTSQYISQAQPVTHVQAQVSPVQPSPLILTAVPRKPTPIQHVQPTIQKQAPAKANVLMSTEELTRDQLVLLEKAYRDSPYPSYHQLAAELKIEVFKVKAWFRKRRRNLHTEIGIEMSKEDEQKVFKQFITQHHDSWRGGQPPPGTPQSSHINTMFRVPTLSPGEEGHESKSAEVQAMEQDGDHSRGSPAQTPAGEGSHQDVTANQTSHPHDLSHHPKQDTYIPQQHVATSKPPTKSKSLPKSSRQAKSKTSTSTIRSLLKKEVKYEPVVVTSVHAPPPVTSPQPQGALITAPQSQTEPAAQPMTYMYQNPEIDQLMREREYLGRLLHQQQMEWQETRKKLVECDRRLAKVTSNAQATTYTTASHQQAVVTEGEQKWHQVPQTQTQQQYQEVPVSTSAQYVAHLERPSSHGSPAVSSEEGQPQEMQAIRLVMAQPPDDTSTTSKEEETEAPQLTQLYAAAPILVHQATENHHQYVWHQDQQHEAAVQYHHGMYQQAPLDGNNNKDQVMQVTGSVENSGSPYYSDYSGSPASSHHDAIQENHGNSGGASKRRNRTTFTRSHLVQEQTSQEAETR